MTVISNEKVCCVVCGAESTYPVVGSIDKFNEAPRRKRRCIDPSFAINKADL